MKYLLTICLLGAALVTGCANRYNVTLSNGTVIGTKSRPRLNKEGTAYQFKDAQGKETVLPAIRVREIEPR